MISRILDFTSHSLGIGGKHQNLVLYILLLLVLLDIGWWGVTHPFMRLYENAVCRAYFLTVDPSKVRLDGFVDELECKIDPVQTAVGSLNGWWSFIESFSGLTVANYFGRLADRRGRKFVFSLNLGMFLISFTLQYAICEYYHVFPDPRELWLTTIPYFAGGGPKMLSPMLMVMLADLVEEAERTKLFMAISAVQLTCELIGSEAGAFLLQRGVFLPLGLGVFFAFLLILGTAFLPETLHLSSKNNIVSNPEYQQAPLIELVRHDLGADSSSDDEDGHDDTFHLQRGIFVDDPAISSRRGYFNMQRIFPPNPVLVPLGIAFYTYYFDVYLAYYAIQWVSIKYTWTISTVGKILPLSAGFRLLNILVIFPFLSGWFRRRLGWGAIQTEITLTQIACAALAIGNFLIGATPPTWHGLILGLAVSSFGASLQPLLRSLMIALVRNDQIGQLMAGITIIQTLCSLMVGPTYAQTLKMGLAMKVLGLPFYLDSALQVVALGCLLTSIRPEQFLKRG